MPKTTNLCLIRIYILSRKLAHEGHRESLRLVARAVVSYEVENSAALLPLPSSASLTRLGFDLAQEPWLGLPHKRLRPGEQRHVPCSALAVADRGITSPWVPPRRKVAPTKAPKPHTSGARPTNSSSACHSAKALILGQHCVEPVLRKIPKDRVSKGSRRHDSGTVPTVAEESVSWPFENVYLKLAINTWRALDCGEPEVGTQNLSEIERLCHPNAHFLSLHPGGLLFN